MSYRVSFAAILFAVACVSPDAAVTSPAVSPPPGGAPARILVSPSSATVAIGASVDLAAIVTNIDGAALGIPVAWSSDAPAVAVVIDGTVVGLAPGTATISASLATMSGEATIRVVDSASASVVAFLPRRGGQSVLTMRTF